MRRSVALYIGAVVAAAVWLLSTLSWTAVLTFSTSNLGGIVAFVVLGVLSETLSMNVKSARATATTSIAFLPLLAGAVVFPPDIAIIVTVLVCSITQVVRRLTLWKVAFNVSQVALIIGTAAHLYNIVGATIGNGALAQLAAFGVLSLAFFATNVLIFSGILALLEEQPLSSAVRRMIGPGHSNVLYDILASPIALVTAALYNEYSIPGLCLVILPLLLIRHSYVSKLQLQQANQDLLRVLIKAVETQDPYTSGHSLRVSALARLIASDLGLRGRTLERVERAALLHDIGKIDIAYSSLLRKDPSFTQDDRLEVRSHTVKGAELLDSLNSVDQEVIVGVRHYHEHYDGTGYPDRLAAEEIPLPARIIAVCEAIDAMLSDRPYRQAFSVEEARGELARCAGSQFDPAIVKTILERYTVERAAALAGPPTPFGEAERVPQPA